MDMAYTASNITEMLNYTIMDNGVKDYLLAIAVFVFAIIVLKIFKYVILRHLKRIAAKTKVKFDDLLIEIVDRFGWHFYVLIAVYIAINFLVVPDILRNLLYYAILISLTYYAVRAVQSLIDYGTGILIQQRFEEEKEADTSVIDLLSRIAKGVVWIIAVLLILHNMGYNITTLIAGLGIGGVAIALAMQSILGDIFASFSIYFDKPFQVGDFIIFGNDMGVVKKIGIKSTRIQALQGQEIVVSNKQLTETVVNNYKKMEQRRIVFSFGVKYETSTERLKKITEIVKDIFAKIELARLDRVHFFKFGDFSLIFEVVYYVATGDYNKYMDVQQEINFALKERFEKEEIEFAYPTQTVIVR
jgi:small-conductance mechanosensitive channel